MMPVAIRWLNNIKFLKTPNTTSNSPINPEVPGKPTEDKTKITNKTEKKTGMVLINKL